MKETNIPRHVAIIVDGNGRWAKKNGKNRSFGHKTGFERLEEIIVYAIEKGVKVISLYVFSTENFKRNKSEVKYLMDLFCNNFKRLEKKYQKENIKAVFSGREEPLEKRVLDAMRDIEEKTKNNTKGIVNFCLNYGGHAEIVDATKKICMDVCSGKIKIEDIDETLFEQNLYHEFPPVDLLIRTSGEQRLSNFLPWQLSYAELYFPETYFPDFTKEEFDKAIDVFCKRNRRFGGDHNENENS